MLDNATLAAAEIGPSLTEVQIKSALLGLLISGGMLIPGNIPNIIAAHALHIKSTEWARLGVPLGLMQPQAWRARSRQLLVDLSRFQWSQFRLVLVTARRLVALRRFWECSIRAHRM